MKYGTDKMSTVHYMGVSLLLFFGVQRLTTLVTRGHTSYANFKAIIRNSIFFRVIPFRVAHVGSPFE